MPPIGKAVKRQDSRPPVSVCCIRDGFQVDSLMETPFSAHLVIFLLTFGTQFALKHFYDKGSNTQKGATLCTQQYVVTRA